MAQSMATINKRGTSWRAIVRREGEATRTATFHGMAQEWVERVEREMAQRHAPGNSQADTMTLSALIDWYIDHAGSLVKWGRSKSTELARPRNYAIADPVASSLRTQDCVRHAGQLRRDGAGPATVGNDLIWIRGVLKAARASLGPNASLEQLSDASEHLRSTRTVAKSKVRKRRLTAGEEKNLLEYFEGRESNIPMADIARFAPVTMRRQEEITRLRWTDLDVARDVCRIADVEHPTKKEPEQPAGALRVDGRQAAPLPRASHRGVKLAVAA